MGINYIVALDIIGTHMNKSKDKVFISACELAIEALEKQLSNGWIPVSERLPTESSQRVIVTLENNCVCEVFYINDKFKFIETLKGGGLKEVPHNNPVIAWQPLPKPYKS